MSLASFFPDSGGATMADGAKADEVPVALIAGVAGGVAGLALIVGVVVLVVFRMQKKANRSDRASQQVALGPSGQQQSYSEPDDVRRPKATLDTVDGRYADFSSGVTQARF